MQHRNRGRAEVSMHYSNTSYEAFMPWRGWMWCLTGLENGEQVVKRTGVVGHKSLSDIETSIFKALLTYHFLIIFIFTSKKNAAKKLKDINDQVKKCHLVLPKVCNANVQNTTYLLACMRSENCTTVSSWRFHNACRHPWTYRKVWDYKG